MWKVASIVVFGAPSSPLNPSISQDSTQDPCQTKWSIEWSKPDDYGDRGTAGLGAELNGYDVMVICGVSQAAVMVGKLTTLSVKAVWDCGDASRDCAQVTIPQTFTLKSSQFPDFSVKCSRGGTVAVQIRARNVLFSGQWSVLASLRAVGFASPVTELQAVEHPTGITVSWTAVCIHLVYTQVA
jgi:hypothetical protein